MTEPAPVTLPTVDAEQLRALAAALREFPYDSAVRLTVQDGEIIVEVDHPDLDRPRFLRVDVIASVTRTLRPAVR